MDVADQVATEAAEAVQDLASTALDTRAGHAVQDLATGAGDLAYGALEHLNLHALGLVSGALCGGRRPVSGRCRGSRALEGAF